MSIESSKRSLWDYESYAAIPYDGKRHEILNGDHFVHPTPNIHHQHVSRHILFQLYTEIELTELGVVMNAPVDVQLTPHDIVQPDIVVITKPRFHIITTTKVKGIPDLVIEILSPSNRNHDLKTKRQVYERVGVPEYWIVFPEENHVLQLVLVDGKYTEQVAKDLITMTVAPHTEVDLKRVW